MLCQCLYSNTSKSLYSDEAVINNDYGVIKYDPVDQKGNPNVATFDDSVSMPTKMQRNPAYASTADIHN